MTENTGQGRNRTPTIPDAYAKSSLFRLGFSWSLVERGGVVNERLAAIVGDADTEIASA